MPLRKRHTITTKWRTATLKTTNQKPPNITTNCRLATLRSSDQKPPIITQNCRPNTLKSLDHKLLTLTQQHVMISPSTISETRFSRNRRLRVRGEENASPSPLCSTIIYHPNCEGMHIFKSWGHRLANACKLTTWPYEPTFVCHDMLYNRQVGLKPRSKINGLQVYTPIEEFYLSPSINGHKYWSSVTQFWWSHGSLRLRLVTQQPRLAKTSATLLHTLSVCWARTYSKSYMLILYTTPFIHQLLIVWEEGCPFNSFYRHYMEIWESPSNWINLTPSLIATCRPFSSAQNLAKLLLANP